MTTIRVCEYVQYVCITSGTTIIERADGIGAAGLALKRLPGAGAAALVTCLVVPACGGHRGGPHA